MRPDIYVMGTSHPLQCGAPETSAESAASFEAELRKLLEKYRIKRIAEEMCVDGLKEHNVPESVAKRVAKQLGIAYEAIDLSRADRSDLSLSDGTLHQAMESFGIEDGGPLRQAFGDLVDGVRERVWIARVLAGKQWPVFFICGSEHAESVRRLWRCLGFASKIVHLDYEP